MLHHITLHLARNKQFPEGSSRYGYEITAPLDGQGHLDQEEWSDKRAYCRVRRFWSDEASVRAFWSIGRAGLAVRPG